MKFKAVVTLLAQRQRPAPRGRERRGRRERDGAGRYMVRARMTMPTSGTVFDVLFIICLSHHLLGLADLCM